MVKGCGVGVEREPEGRQQESCQRINGETSRGGDRIPRR